MEKSDIRFRWRLIGYNACVAIGPRVLFVGHEASKFVETDAATLAPSVQGGSARDLAFRSFRRAAADEAVTPSGEPVLLAVTARPLAVLQAIEYRWTYGS